MPVKKNVKKQIKNAVENLPKTIAREIRETKSPLIKKSITKYDNAQYKKKKIIMWVFVSLFLLAIILMWVININSIFYDFNKTLKNNSLLPWTKAADSLKNTYENDVSDIFNKMDNLLEEKLNTTTNTAQTEKKESSASVKLDAIINAVNNFTSSTTSTTASTENSNTTNTDETISPQ